MINMYDQICSIFFFFLSFQPFKAKQMHADPEEMADNELSHSLGSTLFAILFFEFRLKAVFALISGHVQIQGWKSALQSHSGMKGLKKESIICRWFCIFV